MMSSTGLFDGFMPDAEAPPRLVQRRTDTLPLSNGGCAVDDTLASNHGSPPKLDQQQMLRSTRVHDPLEEEEQRGDDEHTLVGSEHDEPPLARGTRRRAPSALPTPTASNVSFNGSTTPTQAQIPTRTGSQRQQQAQQSQQLQQQNGTNGAQPQNARKPSGSAGPGARVRNTPRLPNHVADHAPSTVMYWSKAPVYGHLPNRAMRAHTVTLIDNLAWQIGGCDHLQCSRDVLTFDTETMQWSHPETIGDVPPPCRAHSATQVDRRIFVFGGGEGPVYYNHLYVLDTLMRTWIKVNYATDDPQPIARRAHATWHYHGKVYLFGGGNGARALNDLWTLDTTLPYERMRWVPIDVRGPKPRPRGYHSANLVGKHVFIIGGSDGAECFEDVWMLSLEKMMWYSIKPEAPIRRLSHTATQVGSYLFVMGGHDGLKYNHELLMFNLVTFQWEPKETRGRFPSSRGYHATLLSDSRLFVIGGFDGYNCFDDVFILDLAAAAYLPQVTSFELRIPGEKEKERERERMHAVEMTATVVTSS